MARTEGEKPKLMRKDRESGMTYRQLAEKYQCSSQYVAKVCGKENPTYFRPVTEHGVIYPALLRWMNENKISMSELLRRMDMQPHHANAVKLRNCLRGDNLPNKAYIDGMLRATGMTYEQLFAEEVQREEA